MRSCLLPPERARRSGLLLRRSVRAKIQALLTHPVEKLLLNWVLGAIDVNVLEPTAGYGYALTLRGAATALWQDGLAERIAGYEKRLAALRANLAAA